MTTIRRAAPGPTPIDRHGDESLLGCHRDMGRPRGAEDHDPSVGDAVSPMNAAAVTLG